jgi:UDP-N-acetylglucosamine transferase subunit ALG13
MTTAYVATLGGHISELVELAPRIEGGDPSRSLWITNDSPQTRDLLADRMVEHVPFIGERDLTGVAAAVPQARRLLRRYGVERVVSTGSAIALAYLPTAAALGLSAHYIESSTRVQAPSMTGRLLARTPGVTCWWQFDDPPPRFHRTGGVYDRFRLDRPGGRAANDPVEVNRVVVTVGTTDRDFRRLIARLVDVLPGLTTPEAEILWQTGASDVSGLTLAGRPIDARPLVPEAELSSAVAAADLVITHAGAGSLAMALRAGKVPVFVPRRAAHGEQLDDHQVELARWADGEGLAVTVEADQIVLAHLEAAARLQVRTTSTETIQLENIRHAGGNALT